MKGKNLSNDLLVAIDVGTTKICVLVAQVNAHNELEILAIGKNPSHGLEKGVIVNVSQAVESIKEAVCEAELMIGRQLESAYVGISGSHIQAFNSQGMVPVKNGQITINDVSAAIASSKAIALAPDHKILHVLPQYYVIDSNQKLQDPIGMHGVRLEVLTHIVTGSVPSIQNLIKCVESAGLKVNDVVLEPIASALAVLSEDECKLGVGMLDIGGGTSDFAIYQQGSIRHTHVIPIAGNIITNDIALCLRSTLKSAEHAKRELQNFMLDESVELEMAQGGQTFHADVHVLVDIVHSRVSELLYILQSEIEKNHLHHLMGAGLVLTGGGSMLAGIKDLAQEILKVPVRIGRPQIKSMFNETLDNPIFATGYGLLLYALKKQSNFAVDYLTEPLITRIFWRMKSWVVDFF
ncbi:cell division protein FtsA [Candidatus Dependentiae bacterium]|nr:cell division protein FtsA [Candidatus Dependentiae bacterium]